MMDRERKKRKEFSFNTNEYKENIEKLLENYYSYSWETEEDKIRRLCTEYIRTFLTIDGYYIGGAKIDTVDSKEEKILKNYLIKLKSIIIQIGNQWVKVMVPHIIAGKLNLMVKPLIVQ